MSQPGRCWRAPSMTWPSVISVPGTARQDRDELPLADALTKSQIFRARAVPPIGGTVRTVVPGEVFVQEITEGLFGAHKQPRAGEHYRGSKMGGGIDEVMKFDRSFGRGIVFTVMGSSRSMIPVGVRRLKKKTSPCDDSVHNYMRDW